MHHPFVESLFRSIYFIVTLVFILLLIKVRNKKRKLFIVRIISTIVISIPTASLIRWGFLELTKLIDNEMWGTLVANLFNIAFFLICVLFSVYSLKVCFEISMRKAIFLVSICCTIEHMSRNITTIIRYFVSQEVFKFMYLSSVTYTLFDIGFAFLFAFLLYFFLFRKQMDKFNYDETLRDNRYIIVAFVNIFVCIFVSSFTSFVLEGTANGFTVFVICPIYAILCCFLGLYLQINIMTSNRLENEKKTLDILIKRESQKNATFTTTMETLQIEIHDLKKKLNRLEEMNADSIDKLPIIEDFNAIIEKYSSFVKTGNPVIDNLLASKYLLAIKEEVDFTYLVDGELLNFMDSDDLTALFDNLLSNAFEAVVNETKDNRVIHLQVKTEKQMTMILIRNYSSIQPKFEQGTPVTYKDRTYHGYGIKSVKRIVEKYFGEVHFNYNNNFFTCRIIFPCSPEEGD